MARVTVTDCLEHVDNRFQLVLIASKRARQLIMGADPLVERGNDKPTVLALREIAAGKIGPSILEETPDVPELTFGEVGDEEDGDAERLGLESIEAIDPAARTDESDNDESGEPTAAEPPVETPNG